MVPSAIGRARGLSGAEGSMSYFIIKRGGREPEKNCEGGGGGAFGEKAVEILGELV